jgi:diphosphomevalonate decarboxylase
VTLSQDTMQSRTTVRLAARLVRDRLWLNGAEEDIGAPRLQACLRALRSHAAAQHPDAPHVRWAMHICSVNDFPTAAGLASSASGFACLVVAVAAALGVRLPLAELSAIARQGSGSACRSLLGGFVGWAVGARPDGADSCAYAIADETHWPDLDCLVLVASARKKDVSSTEGMQTSVATSALLAYRAAQVVPGRMAEMEAAIRARDFDTFARLTMQDSNQFHAVCLDTYPPISYLTDVSRAIIHLVTVYNAQSGGGGGSLRVAYTFDAGPNAVLYLERRHLAHFLPVLLHFFPAPTPPGDATSAGGFWTDRHGVVRAALATPPQDAAAATAKLLSAIRLEPNPHALSAILHSPVGDGPRALAPAASLLGPNDLPAS